MVIHHRPTSRDGFEIAILCAVQLEIDAVEGLFEEDWESERSYGRAPGDDNQYKIGRIGNCNVVMAYPPNMGNNAAVKTAVRLNTSFTGIKLCLLVGVCGGVPSANNGDQIALGDVIISTGVVQFDFGRVYPNVYRAERAEAALPPPPTQIRSLLAKLQAEQTQRTLKENTYQNLIAIASRQEVAYPGANENRLYAASYRHKHQRVYDCEICARCISENDDTCNAALTASCSALGCSDGELINRTAHNVIIIDEERLSQPRIHFGKFASGHFVMRSGTHRDRLSLADGIIAFEMEAAAIWEELPTIVVKSVCDYADSHKNKDWQKYAAFTAAACAKAVIREYRASVEDAPFQPGFRETRHFTIPPADLETAVKQKENGKPSFWSYKMYSDQIGNPVKVQYAANLTKSEELAQKFLNEPMVGIGMHWLEPGFTIVPPDETTVEMDYEHNISIIVLAKEDLIGIFQLSAHEGTTTDQRIAPALKAVLESPATYKAGVLIFQFKDVRLQARYSLRMQGIFELNDMHRVLGRQGNIRPRGTLNSYIPINDLVEEYLQLDHYRGRQMRLSNWSRYPLHDEQITYVANDAYAGYQLFQTMDAERRRMRPTPERPLPAEQQSVEEITAKEVYQPTFLTRKRARETSPETPGSSQTTIMSSPTNEQSPNGESPARRRTQAGIRRSVYPDIVDAEAKFVWKNGEVAFNFGQHRGKTLKSVVASNRSYLGWITNPERTFSSHVVQLARDALNGIYPSQPRQIPIRPAD